MTGVTLELRPWQRDELAYYARVNERSGYPSANLIRRGFITRVRVGVYAITALGRAALEESENSGPVRPGLGIEPATTSDSSSADTRYCRSDGGRTK